MKKILLTILLITFSTISLSYAIDGERFLQSEEAVKNAAYGHIDAKGLKALIDSETFFILLDARGSKWNDSNTLPRASLASYENTPEDFEAIIPQKETLIVLYCYSFNCPLSTKLAQKLVSLGYTNLLEYPGGLKEWRDIANYPVDDILE